MEIYDSPTYIDKILILFFQIVLLGNNCVQALESIIRVQIKSVLFGARVGVFSIFTLEQTCF